MLLTELNPPAMLYNVISSLFVLSLILPVHQSSRATMHGRSGSKLLIADKAIQYYSSITRKNQEADYRVTFHLFKIINLQILTSHALVFLLLVDWRCIIAPHFSLVLPDIREADFL